MAGKKIQITWIIAWGLLLGFCVGAITLNSVGRILWGYVSLTMIAAWLISYLIAIFINRSASKKTAD